MFSDVYYERSLETPIAPFLTPFDPPLWRGLTLRVLLDLQTTSFETPWFLGVCYFMFFFLQVLLRCFLSLRNLSQVFTGPTLNRLWSLLFLLLHLILTLGWRCFHLTNISLKVPRDLVSRHIFVCFCWRWFLRRAHFFRFLDFLLEQCTQFLRHIPSKQAWTIEQNGGNNVAANMFCLFYRAMS